MTRDRVFEDRASFCGFTRSVEHLRESQGNPQPQSMGFAFCGFVEPDLAGCSSSVEVAITGESQLADHGLDRACAEDAGLCRGVVTARGRCLHRLVAERFGVPFGDPEELFGGVGAPHGDR